MKIVIVPIFANLKMCTLSFSSQIQVNNEQHAQTDNMVGFTVGYNGPTPSPSW